MKLNKIIKKISLLLILIHSVTFSQTNNLQNTNYVGTWEYLDNSNIFRLTIWEDAQPNPYDGVFYLEGHYEMLQVDNNGNQTIIYTSNPPELQYNQKLPNAFSGTVYNSANGIEHFGGAFKQIHAGGGSVLGNFTIELIPVCPSCNKKIRWLVKKGNGVNFHQIGTTQPPNTILVPSDIELTKI